MDELLVSYITVHVLPTSVLFLCNIALLKRSENKLSFLSSNVVRV